MAKEITQGRLKREALLEGYREADQPVDRFSALREEPGPPAPPVRLDGLRQLIFLDRYAQKDPQRRFRPGEPVVVQVKDDPRAPEKEVGRVVTAGEGRVTVQLLQSGEVIDRPSKLVERPLETQPAQMWDRMARAAAGVEIEDQRAEWERAFRWALDGFRFVPGGRISTMLGTGQNLTAYNCFSGETIVLTEAGPKPIKELSGPVRVMGHDGAIREAEFGLYGVDRLWRIELENGQVIHATANHRWPYLTAKGNVRWTTTQELAGKRLIRTTAGRPFDQDEVEAGMRHGIVYGDGTVQQRKHERWRCTEKSLVKLYGASTQLASRLEGFASWQPKNEPLPRKRRSTVRVVSIEPTDRIEPVYCCEEPETHSFVIEGGLWTGNCYVIPLQPDAGPGHNDSRRSIIDTLGRMVEIMSRGGGVGINLSTLRPQLAPVRGVNGRSSGSVSWGGLFSFATGLVEQGGSRRGALMVMIDDWHPDLLRFIRAKQTMGAITNANMSVCVSDAFMRAVREDGEWELVFPDTSDPEYDRLWDGDLRAWRERGKPVEVHDRVRAREVWNEIVTSAWKSAEPGVVFIDRYNDYSNARYYARIACTNPCFAGSTRLATSKGYLTFEELHRVGEPVLVATDQRASVSLEEAVGGGRYATPGVSFHPGSRVFLTRRQAPVLRLTTAHGFSVTATPDHRFLTPAGYVELQDLRPGDVLYLQSGEGAWAEDPELPEAARAARTQVRLAARARRGEAEPPQRWSREVGQFLGWVTGDGYTYDRGEKPVVALLFGPQEVELVPHFRSLLRGWFGVDGSVSTRNRTTALQYDASVARFARALGVRRGRAGEKRVPESLWSAPREAVIGFLQGLFTSDGTVNLSEAQGSCTVRLGSSSRELLEEVQLLLLNLGIVGRLYQRRRGGIRLLPDSQRQPRPYATSERHELLIDKENRDRFAREIGFLTQVKQSRLEGFISAKARRSNREQFATRVTGVEPAGREDVYDLTEPVTHSLIAGGLVAHNCGEQGLPPFGVCNLGHVNLARFVEGEPGGARVLWEELARAVWLGVRFLDNVIDITPYFLAENEALQKDERRVGLGTMGLGEMLIRLGIRYGADESLAFMDHLYGFITRHAYRASVAIAREKGSFPRFEAEGFLSSAFMRAMPQEIQEAVRAHGIRNVTLITQAPTGTTGSMVGTSTGIEPYYSWTYFRKGRLGRKRVVEPVVAQVLGIGPEEAERLEALEGQLPDSFVTALELTPEEHVRVQAVAQRWCDSSISKTANLPAEYTLEQTEAIYRLAYDLGCKGVTIYRDRSRDEQVLSRT